MAEGYAVTEFPRSQTFAEYFAALFNEIRPAQTKQSGLVAQVLGRVEEQAKALGQFNDPRGIYARMPLEIQVR